MQEQEKFEKELKEKREKENEEKRKKAHEKNQIISERLVQCKKKIEDNLAKLRIKIDEKEKTSEKIIENLQKKKEEEIKGENKSKVKGEKVSLVKNSDANFWEFCKKFGIWRLEKIFWESWIFVPFKHSWLKLFILR